MTHARTSVIRRPAATRTPRLKPVDRRRNPVGGAVLSLPNEPLPGEDAAWEFLEPVRPETPHSRGLRFLDVAGELLAAVAIIGGGMVLTGFASLL